MKFPTWLSHTNKNAFLKKKKKKGEQEGKTDPVWDLVLVGEGRI
jgi:hypothetical protein